MCRNVFDRYRPPQEVPIEGLTHSKCRRATNLLVLFLERFSRFSLTTFYTTFIYGAQAIIDGCNTNLDSIFFRGDESLSIFRAAKSSQPLHFLEFSHDTRSIDACARDCACAHTVRLRSSAHKYL